MYADTTLHTCCAEPSDNITLTGDDIFLPPIYGDITITYDVLQTYASNYKAMVILLTVLTVFGENLGLKLHKNCITI